MPVGQEQRWRAKRARKSVNSILKEYYSFWLHRFQADSEQFIERVTRFIKMRLQSKAADPLI
jgi:hypothetical protein